MSNQRAIAAELGLTQATVSMALRDDPGISLKTRQEVLAVAERLGYKPNSYVASLMKRIRTGRPVPEKGRIGVLYDGEGAENWMGTETFKAHHLGIVEKAADLGFQAKEFYLRAPDFVPESLEETLEEQNINGLVLPGTRAFAGENLDLKWERYSMASIAYDWRLPWLDRVASHHRHNVETAFREVVARDYKRIGMCFPPEGWKGVDSSWRAGFYLAQELLPRSRRLPPFIGKPGITPLATFRDWLEKWKPDVLISLIGHEMDYLRELGINVPEDLGIACVNRPLGTAFSGVEENQHCVGATVAELVISGILRNEYGPPEHSKLILIEGTWVDGATLRSVE